jgi:calcium-independent phospholipase A2-gamma
MDLKCHEVAVTAALGVVSEQDAIVFLRNVGMQPLFEVLTQPDYLQIDVKDISMDNIPFGDSRVEAVKGICRIIRAKKDVADIVGSNPKVVEVLTDLIEAPMKGFGWVSNRDKQFRAQREATALVQRLVRSSDEAVRCLRQNDRLVKALNQVIAVGDKKIFSDATAGGVVENNSMVSNVADFSIISNRRKEAKKTKIVDFDSKLNTPAMARVAAWGLGGVSWKKKYAGQKGLRILSFDGGGTRGVVSIAFLKELLNRAGKTHPHEMFDIVCGTSTGGILAVLIGGQRASIEDTEAAYDSFIDKIFAVKSNLRLVQEQAAYDESELEKVLHSFTGDELLIDTNKNSDVPRVFCVSTKVNNNPPLIHLWRNYNYSPKPLPEQESRYGGHFRINSATAIRATTAAPTYFTPVRLDLDGGLYCDGALVANNPTAVAVQEAKAIFPNIPIEYVVSIGTGYCDQKNNASDLGWNLLVNQIIASSVDTEDVHHLLRDFMPSDRYFRFNLLLKEDYSIDEKNKTILSNLKKMARQEFDKMANSQPQRIQNLIKSLAETPSHFI